MRFYLFAAASLIVSITSQALSDDIILKRGITIHNVQVKQDSMLVTDSEYYLRVSTTYGIRFIPHSHVSKVIRDSYDENIMTRCIDDSTGASLSAKSFLAEYDEVQSKTIVPLASKPSRKDSLLSESDLKLLGLNRDQYFTYQVEKKNGGMGFIWWLVFPGGGNFYAENTGMGVFSLIAELGCVGWYVGENQALGIRDEINLTPLYVLMGVRFVDLVSTFASVSKYNDRLLERVSLQLGYNRIGLKYNF